MLSQLGPFGPGISLPFDLRGDAPGAARADRVEPLRGGRATTDLPSLPDRASDRAQEVARANRPDQRVAVDELIPPDPNAPAGPSPAFEASILDRARENALSPPAAPDTPDVIATDELAALIAGPDASGTFAKDTVAPDPYNVPPTAEARVFNDMATLRRIETPYDTVTVDVSR